MYIPLPPPSPTISWKNLRAEHEARLKSTNLECAKSPLDFGPKTDDTLNLLADDSISATDKLPTDANRTGIPLNRPLTPNEHFLAGFVKSPHSRPAKKFYHSPVILESCPGPTTGSASEVMNSTQKDAPPWLKTFITESRCLSPGGEPSAPPVQFDSAQTLLEEKADGEPGFPGGLPIHELET